MRIAINALSARTGGGVVYLNRLIYYLREMDNENEYYIFVTGNNHNKIIAFEDPQFHVIEVHIRSLLRRLLYEQIALPILLKRLNIDTVYAPAEIAPFLAPCPVVLGIQNLNVYYKSRSVRYTWTGRARTAGFRLLARFSAKKAEKIIFVSETSRRYIAGRLDVEVRNTAVIHHGVELAKFSKHDHQISCSVEADKKDHYILCVSLVTPHKNCECLIEAYGRLGERIRNAHDLVIVGPHQYNVYYDKLLNCARGYNIDEKVHFLGDVPFESMPEIYQGADLFVLPSLLETFGIPLIEAMASSVPVIAANSTSCPEVVGDAGILFDPTNPDELSEKITMILQSRSMRDEMIRKGLARARSFPWDNTARKTLAVFKEVYRSR